jgi:hypothetical protein
MLAVLATVPRIEGSPFVFTNDGGKRPISGYSTGKSELDKFALLPEWDLRDLRRTFVSGCNSFGTIKGATVELCVNHISGSFGGVAGVYNVYGYLPEKTEAWNLWNDRVSDLAKGRRND